jgi:hypothetical protein
MVATTLRDEALIQIRLSSEQLDGVTLQKIAQAHLVELQIRIVILEFLVRLFQWIGRIVAWPGILPRRVFNLVFGHMFNGNTFGIG